MVLLPEPERPVNQKTFGVWPLAAARSSLEMENACGVTFLARGHDVDKPRNLAKSVTVE